MFTASHARRTGELTPLTAPFLTAKGQSFNSYPSSQVADIGVASRCSG